MGLEQSSMGGIDQFWEGSGKTLMEVPGCPQQVKCNRSLILAERYLQESNGQDQAMIYRERKICHHNIVGIHDFELKKGVLGCACNNYQYIIITERIPYRLSSISNLSASQMIYILHQSLCGYSSLNKYGRLCYPSADMIGIKQNGDVKVWVNSNWADNSFRISRSERMSIQGICNLIKLCGDSCKVAHVSLILYQLPKIDFELVIQMLRDNFGRDLVEGKFSLQKKVRNIPNKILEQTKRPEHEQFNFRPRAFSENLNRTQINFFPPEHQNKFILQSPQNFIYQKPMSVTHHQIPQIKLIQTANTINYHENRIVSKSVQRSRPDLQIGNKKTFVEYPKRTIIRNQIESRKEVSSKTQVVNSQYKQQKNMISFNYKNAELNQNNQFIINKITQNSTSRTQPSSRNNRVNIQYNYPLVTIQRTSSLIRADSKSGREMNHGLNSIESGQSGKQGSFELNLNLANVIARQEIQTERGNSNSIYDKNSFKSERPTMENHTQTLPQITNIFNHTNCLTSSHINEGSQPELDELSQSKKVAEEFKYYLRSSNFVEQNRQEQQELQQLDGNDENRYAYRNITPAISERWEQEESFSQQNI